MYAEDQKKLPCTQKNKTKKKGSPVQGTERKGREAKIQYKVVTKDTLDCGITKNVASNRAKCENSDSNYIDTLGEKKENISQR